MKVTGLAFVGIPVTNMKRSRAFYEGVLGLTPDPEMMGEVWTEYPIGTGTLAIGCVGEQWKPSRDGTSAALEVDNLEDTLSRLTEHKIERHEVESPVCRMAIIQDPDGNKLIIHKLK
jgi:predicted enzyme related to lactoylglutathione lyase